MRILWLLVVSSVGWAAPETTLETRASSRYHETWNAHFETTVMPQGRTRVSDPAETLPSEFHTYATSTLYLGLSPWRTTEVYLNADLAMGRGTSKSYGLYTNGDALSATDSASTKGMLSRAYVQQVIPLTKETEWRGSEMNQIAGYIPTTRLELLLGRVSLSDFIDDNTYSHNARTQFMNWGLMGNSVWASVADGSVWGGIVAFHQNNWALRWGSTMVPKTPGASDNDPRFLQARGDTLEWEYGYQVNRRPGKLRLLAFSNTATRGSYRDADVTQSRALRSRLGAGIGFEQEITPDLGVFLRAAWSDGETETSDLTEMDQMVGGGISLAGHGWKRPHDRVGLGVVAGILSGVHRAYLARQKDGLRYVPEWGVETYYQMALSRTLFAALDFQHLMHPGFDERRDSVSALAARLHFEI